VSQLDHVVRDVAYWHKADMPAHPPDVRYWSNSGHWAAVARNALVANDAKQTLNVF
jgi:hypothetical protein